MFLPQIWEKMRAFCHLESCSQIKSQGKMERGTKSEYLVVIAASQKVIEVMKVSIEGLKLYWTWGFHSWMSTQSLFVFRSAVTLWFVDILGSQLPRCWLGWYFDTLATPPNVLLEFSPSMFTFGFATFPPQTIEARRELTLIPSYIQCHKIWHWAFDHFSFWNHNVNEVGSVVLSVVNQCSFGMCIRM